MREHDSPVIIKQHTLQLTIKNVIEDALIFKLITQFSEPLHNGSKALYRILKCDGN